jgi:hypothetical protein
MTYVLRFVDASNCIIVFLNTYSRVIGFLFVSAYCEMSFIF